MEAGAKVRSLCVHSKSFYLFFFGVYSNVTRLLHKLLILFYLSDKTFFRFSPISLTSLSFFSPKSLKRADLLATMTCLRRYYELSASLLWVEKLAVMEWETRY